ncbi:deoxyguanosinetriphosphate triphosphohydrolase [Hydrogenoanaerobacterium sp.]|uniref:deoxyguanosinetriphosphate triphosphohydrolase n=1 Tax=Hydrogenoanaerobacterium sp. TaxID=2953763 RepID=UPI0028993689|nr:deoxyguanosinetriphosphate triphosphohydrolase [Hydrogenoanaerobacterium sp.]
MTIRKRSEDWEHQTLSTYASFSDQSRGRDREEPECDIRTAYQRDRDRILHCNSFRRLMHKTQVFICPEGDHYRTRLTHTLEVSQIARTIARALRLNEDLTEAIAMGHDLGHTPFGHAGEKGLDEISPNGYKHFMQSVRVVEHLEHGGAGLNLTFEVRNGIQCHSHGSEEAVTQEGRIVRFADKTAYMNHDIEDAIRAQIITEEELPFNVKCTLGRSKSERISSLVDSIVRNSAGDIIMGAQELAAYKELREFMFAQVYKSPIVRDEEDKAAELVKRLYEYFARYADKLPTEYKLIVEREGADRAICDYISGMSDRFAIGLYEELFIPRSWTKQQ